MPDWLKTLVGALAGLIVGLLSEPLKGWISGKSKETQMRNALYGAMADLYGFFSGGKDSALRQRYQVGFIEANLDIFDHYSSTDKATFYRLREAPHIKSFFHLVRKTFDELPQQTGSESEANVRALLASMQFAIQSGAISSRRLHKLLSNGPSWKTH
jgi:hypothetical protein